MAQTFTASATGTAAATITVPSGSIINYLAWSYSSAPTGGNLTVYDGVQNRVNLDITAAGPGYLPTSGIAAAGGNTVTITLAGGGAAVVGKVNWL